MSGPGERGEVAAMPERMQRGKNQILYNYLPERTVDFERGGAIAKITRVAGLVPQDLTKSVVIERIASEARAWREENRPALRNELLADPDRFELIEPEAVYATLFPRVFWCQNRRCGRVYDYSHSDALPRARCPECQDGTLVQLRFVTIHDCGLLEPLAPPHCACNAGNGRMALDTRQSERISAFRWICRACRRSTSPFAGLCPRCPGTPDERAKRTLVHRAGAAYYPYTANLLNIPEIALQGLVRRPSAVWVPIIAASALQLDTVRGQSLRQLAQRLEARHSAENSVPQSMLAELTRQVQAGEITPAEMVVRIQELSTRGPSATGALNPEQLSQEVETVSGLPIAIWSRAGHEILEHLMCSEMAEATIVCGDMNAHGREVGRLGLSEVSLISEFPIITASYGFSRGAYGPNAANLNPFPPDVSRGGRLPIFVDKVEADAICVRVSQQLVLEWLQANQVELPQGILEASDAVQMSYFVQLFDESSLLQTIGGADRSLRLVFCLLHTLSHLLVRHAALLCGLERTSLSEYLLPRSLRFVLYASRREGATIGALTAMFEQTLTEWLAAALDSRRCIYDPVCSGGESSCHACTHLAETSCRYFNLNLSRAVLFGGADTELGQIKVGFLDFLV